MNRLCRDSRTHPLLHKRNDIRKPLPGQIGRMVAAVRRALRKIFPDLKLSNAEILEIVAKAKRAVVEGGGRQNTETTQTRMSRAVSEEDVARVLEMATVPRSAKTLAEARAIVRAFPDRDFVNSSTGLRATISLTNLTKMVSESAVRKSVSPAVHAQAVANVDVLFERALHEGAYPDRHNDPNIAAIHRFYAPMLSDGGLLQVKLTVKELKRADQGNRVYSVEAMEIQEPARNWKDSTVAEKLPTSFPHAGSFDQEIVTQWAQVNRRKDLRFSQNLPQPDNAETESAHQYREAERAYGGRAAYDKAKADGRTKLTYGQWVQVRTPNFKKWFGDWEAVANRKFLDGSPISVLTGEEFKPDGVPLTQKVPRWYAENGYSSVNVDGIGPVALDAVAVKHSLGHGIGRDKATAFAAVPDVLRDGRIIHREAMRASTGGMVYHVAAPIEIAGRPFVMDVLVKSDDNARRMYVHEVALREKLQQSDFKVGAVAAKAGKRADAAGAGVIRTVLQNVYGVNPSSVSKVVDPETGEPLVVYHGTTGGVEYINPNRTLSAEEKQAYEKEQQLIFDEYKAKYKEVEKILPAHERYAALKQIDRARQSGENDRADDLGSAVKLFLPTTRYT